MRIRTVKPAFFLHEELYELEKKTGLPIRVAYIGLWCAADCAGRFEWKPRKLGAQILPYDSQEPNCDAQKLFLRILNSLVEHGFVKKYQCASVVFGCIPSFAKHQSVNAKERASELPDPLSSKELSICEARVDEVGNSFPCGIWNMEGKGSGTEVYPANAFADDSDELFNFTSPEQGDGKEPTAENEQDAKKKPSRQEESRRIFDYYPRRVDKARALKATEVALGTVKADVILGCLEDAISRWEQENRELEHLPYMATWIHKRPWEDYDTPPNPSADFLSNGLRGDKRKPKQAREEASLKQPEPDPAPELPPPPVEDFFAAIARIKQQNLTPFQRGEVIELEGDQEVVA